MYYFICVKKRNVVFNTRATLQIHVLRPAPGRSVIFMAKVCEVCGRGPQFGHRISHAHNVTKRRWDLNLQSVHAVVKGAGKRIRVCTSCIRNGKVKKAATGPKATAA